jgi:MFS family permease
MPRDLLGPSQARRRAVRLADDLAEVVSGLLAGAGYVLSRRAPRAALGVTSAYSFLFGPLFLMTILLYRNYFYPGHVTVAESHIGTLAVISAAGYVCAALITPPATRRLSKRAWITLMLIVAAVVAAAVGETFNQVAYLAIGFLMYLTRQSVAITSVTILQEGIEDGFRGRVFAFYDMLYNAAYALGAALFAVFMASDGKSPGVVAVVAVGFLVAAVAYWLSAGPSPIDESPADASSAGESPADADAGRTPSSDAQRSSS